MNLDHWKQIEPILNHVLTLETPQERTRYIRRHCPDEQLRAEIESLLESIESSQHMWEGLLESNQVLVENMSREDFHAHKETLPEQIGSYRIEKRIGRGGMGDVYLGARAGADFHKQVAVKVLRKDATDQNQVQRFLQERSLLSRLNHPNIARLLDGGITKDGRPFIVMEYVDGVPLTEYCTQHNCNVEQRLELFIQACKAVHAAHTNFIVHRDLKPSNLLVTEDGVVKVLDFGIAKLLDQELSEQEVFETRKGNRIFSLNYAAPEQISLEPVTTATDVYALGLLLYELLTTERPFDYKNIKLAEAEKIILNQDPKLPSSVARGHASALRGDLDAIIMKALRKEPGQRYSSALTLMEEIERYLKHQPVYARKGSLQYRTKKFVARNKVSLFVLAAMISVLLILSSIYALRINQEKKVAEAESQKSEQISQFLIELFEGANPYNETSEAGVNTKIGTLLEAGTQKLEAELDKQPEIKAYLQNVIGEVYFRLGEFSKSESLLVKSISTAKKSENKAVEGLSLYNLARLYQETAEIEKADSILNRSIALFENSEEGFTNNDALAAISLYGNLLWFNNGKFSKAESLLTKRLNLSLEYFPENLGGLAIAYNDLATVNHAQGKFDKAISFYTKAVEMYEKSSDNEANLAIVLANLAILFRENGDLAEAEKMQKRSLEITQKNEDQYPIDVAIGIGNLSEINVLKGNYKIADSLAKISISKLKSLYGDLHPYLVRTKMVLAISYRKQKKFKEAKELFTEIQNEYSKVYPEDHPRLADPLEELSKLHLDMGNTSEAVKLLEKAFKIKTDRYPAGSWRLAETMTAYGNLLSIIGEYKQADSLLIKSHDILKMQFGPENRRTQISLQNLNAHKKRIK